MLIFDAHLDLSLNALDWNRDLRLPADQIRAAEENMHDLAGRAAGTVTLPDMRRGHVGICVATLIAPTSRPQNPVAGWRSPEQSWAQIQGQLAWYRAMEMRGEMVAITDRTSLSHSTDLWLEAAAHPDNDPPTRDAHPIGFVLSLEGADPILDPSQLEELYGAGLRALGPAHYGHGRYASGTDASGRLSPAGRELVAEMDRLGIILDVSHLCDDALPDALDLHSGTVWASHTNSRALVPHNRQFSDAQYLTLIERGAVIGVAADAWMLAPGWIKHQSTPTEMGVTLESLANHIDHICQLAGSSEHAGIGSDLDGGFGREQSPADLDTIADLQQLTSILDRRGYSLHDIKNILHQNLIRTLDTAWQA